MTKDRLPGAAPAPFAAASAPRVEDWRGRLRLSIGRLLLVKLVALLLIETLFFSGDDRVEVTPHLVDAQLKLDSGSARASSADPGTPRD